MPHYRVHRLIQNLARDPELVARFLQDKGAMCDDYGLTPVEREAVVSGAKGALIALGVHPNLQMKLFGATRAPAIGGQGLLASYFRKLEALAPYRYGT